MNFSERNIAEWNTEWALLNIEEKENLVETGSRKIRCNYIGPLVIFKAVGPNQFLLMSLDGLIYPHLIEQSRLKAGTIWTTKRNVNN